MTTTRGYVIIVGFDFSESAQIALQQAVATAAENGRATLHVIGALSQRLGLPLLPGEKADYRSAENFQEEIRAVVQSKLAEHNPAAVTFFVHVRIGWPGEEILRLASEAEADLIVVGTHNRRGLERLLLGSVSEHVLRHARCPVLIARPKGYTGGPQIPLEPPCALCVETRRESRGETWWCPEHSQPHPRPHRYSYRSTMLPPQSPAFPAY